jgi:RTX calcium-binding nonapeptide repeat (4 copies)
MGNWGIRRGDGAVEQGREKTHTTRRTLYLPELIVAAVLVACVVALLTVERKAEASFPGKYGRIDQSREVSVPKKCEAAGPAVCRGTRDDDYISGTPNDDTIKSLAGRDYVLGRDGDDTAFGGPGNDIIQGAHGRDYLYGGEGGDSLFGGVGPDGIYPAQGEDEVQAGDGDDRIYAPHDVLADRISCGKGDDRVVSGKEDHIAKDCEVSRPASGDSITAE